MAITRAQERQLLTGAELEAVRASHHPDLAAMPRDEALSLARRLRDLRDRLRDQVRDQRRARSGKAGTRPASGAEEGGLSRRKQAVGNALRRVNARVDRLGDERRASRNASRLREALDRRRAAPTRHPSAGRTASAGMRAIDNADATTGVDPATVGRVSQRNKDAQARSDAR